MVKKVRKRWSQSNVHIEQEANLECKESETATMLIVTTKFEDFHDIRRLLQVNILYHEVHSVPCILPSISQLSGFMIKVRDEQTKHGWRCL